MSDSPLATFDWLTTVEPFLFLPHQKAWLPATTHILGIEFDGTTSFRPGARFGPNAIRSTAKNLEDYSPYLDRELDPDGAVDMGNLPFYPSRQDLLHQAFDQLTQSLDWVGQRLKLLTLGGEHSISWMPITHYLRQYPDLLLIHLDAHADLRDGYLGDKFSHACVIRRVLDHFGAQHQLMQYGIRSGTRAEFEFMRHQHTLRTSLTQFCQDLQQVADSRPIYLTLDLDFFDPAYLPGTGTPEAGGENFHNFIKIVKILATKNFVGADVVELAPQLDPTGHSTCFAAKVTRELLLALT
ncbi:MAG: agmatinase [Legionellales bacterium]|nr:agmatinase [Legionellales bacterium]